MREKWLNTHNINQVKILDSNFINNTAYHPAIIIKLYLLFPKHNISYFTISNCTFTMNSNLLVLAAFSYVDMFFKHHNQNTPLYILRRSKIKEYFDGYYMHMITINLNNSVFIQTGIGKDMTAIYCCNAVLNLNGPLVFKNFKSKTHSIIRVEKTNVTIHGYIEFFNNSVVSLLSQEEISNMQLKRGFSTKHQR